MGGAAGSSRRMGKTRSVREGIDGAGTLSILESGANRSSDQLGVGARAGWDGGFFGERRREEGGGCSQPRLGPCAKMGPGPGLGMGG
jgi:hypothetical protein